MKKYFYKIITIFAISSLAFSATSCGSGSKTAKATSAVASSATPTSTTSTVKINTTKDLVSAAPSASAVAATPSPDPALAVVGTYSGNGVTLTYPKDWKTVSIPPQNGALGAVFIPKDSSQTEQKFLQLTVVTSPGTNTLQYFESQYERSVSQSNAFTKKASKIDGNDSVSYTFYNPETPAPSSTPAPTLAPSATPTPLKPVGNPLATAVLTMANGKLYLFVEQNASNAVDDQKAFDTIISTVKFNK